MWLLIFATSKFGIMVCDQQSPTSTQDFELSLGQAQNEQDDGSFVRRRIRILNLSPRNGSVIWAAGDSCNVDMRFEVHGGTISFVDRSQMVINPFL